MRGGWIRAAALAASALLACSSGDDDGTSKPTSSAAPAASPAPTPAPKPDTSVKVEGPPKVAGIEPRIKSEVDNRADGMTGSALAPAGAKAVLQTAKEWQATKGDFTVVQAADKKAGISAGAGGDEKSAAAAAALGLTDCQWNPQEILTVGKNKLPGSGADGLCTRSGAKVKAALVTLKGENLLVLGAWEEGGDDKSVFGSLRSIARPEGSGGGIQACCDAIKKNRASAPPEQQGGYDLAYGACIAAVKSPDSAKVLATVRGMLKSANIPAECK
jgi:hypothetical protein